MAQQATLLKQARDDSSQDVDIVFYGSSLLEYWLGSSYGRFKKKEIECLEAFQQYFGGAKHHASLNGLVMAMSADTTNSLWHGIITRRTLPDWLNPKIIWIVVGTNDMAHFMCSAESVHLATLQLIRDIRRMRPNAKIVLNSMLPAFDVSSLADNPANKVFAQINDLRKSYVATQPNLYYFDSSTVFLSRDQSNQINKTLYKEDFVHPSALGYRVWGKAMADFAHELIDT